MASINKKLIIREAKHYGIMLLGVSILSFGLFNIHSQSKITEGGILGFTLLLAHWFGISPGVSSICLDATCYFVGLKLLGKRFLKNAIVSSIGFSLTYRIYEHIGYILPDLSSKPAIAAVVGGIFVGIGAGLVVREGGASGGDDALAFIISKKSACKISYAYFASDFVVLMLSASYIPLKNVIFSLATVTVSAFVLGKLQKAKKPAMHPAL